MGGAIGIAAVGPVGLAEADPSFAPVADGLNHTYCFTGGFGAHGAAHDAMSNLDAQTRFTRDFRSCGGGEIDVVFQVFYDSCCYGAWQCMTVGANGRCRNSAVFMNPTRTGGVYRQERKTLCHEVGHSGGLNHDTGVDDCMITGTVYDDNHKSYSGHHVDHLNSN